MAEKRISGIGVSEGIRIGKALRFSQHIENNHTDDIQESQVQSEVRRLTAAKGKCIQEMDNLVEKVKKDLGEEKAVIIKGQRSFFSDPAFCPAMERLIVKKLYSAEKAVNQVVKDMSAIFEKMPNEYMRERAADVRDVGKRLLNALSGESGPSLGEIKEPVILVAEDLAPSDTVQLNKQYVLALITKKGGKTSHTSIFSRSMGIPAIVGAGEDADLIKTGDELILDGLEGICIIHPEEATLAEFQGKLEEEQKSIHKLKEFEKKNAVTKDGFRIEIAANIGSSADAAYAVEQGAEGIGLLRTELIYMSSKSLPNENEQFETYKKILETMEGKPVIIRTLDIGGDKELPYLKIPKEMNPFLGYRAIRLCLEEKHILVTQLRAILRASAYGKAKIMFPMISSIEEWRKAKTIFTEVKARLDQEGLPYDSKVELGIMIEVPSAALLARQFAKEVDFFSIGTNDLVQYTLAVDRMNEKVAYLYDHFHPAVISLIRHVVREAHAEGKFVGMCGGMAGDPSAIPLLAAMELDELSMSASEIHKAKYIVNQISMEDCRKLLDKVMKNETIEQTRDILKDFQKNMELK